MLNSAIKRPIKKQTTHTCTPDYGILILGLDYDFDKEIKINIDLYILY